jgi:hypothetical protein
VAVFLSAIHDGKKLPESGAARKEWEKASAVRARIAVRECLGESFVMVLLGSMVALMFYLLFKDSLGSFGLLVPSVIPTIPAVWGVNQLIQHPHVTKRSLIPWSICISVGALYGVLPELSLIGFALAIGGTASSALLLEALLVAAGSTLVFGVAIRRGQTIPVLSQLYPQPGQDPTVPG